MAKSSRFKHAYRKNASKLHKAVGETIRSHPLLKHYTSYQEYPVSKVNPEYQNNSHHFDWIILDLKCVIECHGAQHFSRIPFFHKTEEDYQDQLRRDEEKKTAAELAGWSYFIVKFDEELDVDKLIGLAIANNTSLKAPSKPVKPFKNKSNVMTPVQKEKAREARKKGYQRAKEWQKKVKKERENKDDLD